MQKKDLCVVCSPTEELENTRELKCDYCGAPAVCGWGASMSFADGTKNEEGHNLCEQCLKDGRTKRT
jgi:hypothetical protein